MQKSPGISDNRTLLIILAILLPAAYFLNLGSYQLIFEEPRRALVALEMLIDDNYIVPTTNGTLYYNKPPLYNWVLIPFLKVFGHSEWVVRLPSLLSLFATALIHFRFSRKYIGELPALLSSLFYLTSADILFYFSLLGEIDIFYALLVYLQALAIFYFYEKGKFAQLFLWSYFFTAAGVLTKGIPSLFFQAITLLVIFILNRRIKVLFSVWHLAGILFLLLTAGGYFYIYSLKNDPAPYLARLFTETFSRTSVEMKLSDSLSHLVKFPIMLLKISAPWCLLFFLVPRKACATIKANRFLQFSLWFCLANGLIYFLSPGTRERYLYMFFPFIYSILAVAVCSWQEEKSIWINRFNLLLVLVSGAGLLGLGIYSLTLDRIYPALACIVLSSLAFGYRWIAKPRFLSELLVGAAGLFLLARIGYDVAILPMRKINDPYKADARNMARIVGKEEVILTGPPEAKTDDVRFAGIHFATFKRNEPAFLAFQTSYYLSDFTGRIIRYSTDTSRNGFYIAPEQYVRQGAVRAYYRFNNRINGADNWYILFKYL